MGSAAVEIKLGELDALARKIKAFELSGGDKQRLLSELGSVIVEQTQDRISLHKESPEGDPWKDITEAYKKRKRKTSRGGILERDGDLLQSIGHQLTGRDSILIGSPEEYADFHQNAKSKERRRKFLGLSTKNIEELQYAVDAFMRGHVA